MTAERMRDRGWWLLATIAIAAAGCQQEMAAQPSFRPLEPCSLFADGRASQPLVAGTVARGHLRTNVALETGRKSRPASATSSEDARSEAEESPAREDENRDFVDEFPVPIDLALMEHGRNRFEIYCVVCHDSLGTGHGKIVERGYTRPPSYHIARLRDAPVGRLFAVVSEGYGSMPSYAGQIPTNDRWAIVAYVRALQLSQHLSQDNLPDEMRQAAVGQVPTIEDFAP